MALRHLHCASTEPGKIDRCARAEYVKKAFAGQQILLFENLSLVAIEQRINKFTVNAFSCELNINKLPLPV